MALGIVWRNQIPFNCGDISVERIAEDEFGTVYEVRRPGRMSVFEVTYGCRLPRVRLARAHAGEAA
jgi:hypothetical protein